MSEDESETEKIPLFNITLHDGGCAGCMFPTIIAVGAAGLIAVGVLRSDVESGLLYGIYAIAGLTICKLVVLTIRSFKFIAFSVLQLIALAIALSGGSLLIYSDVLRLFGLAVLQITMQVALNIISKQISEKEANEFEREDRKP